MKSYSNQSINITFQKNEKIQTDILREEYIITCLPSVTCPVTIHTINTSNHNLTTSIPINNQLIVQSITIDNETNVTGAPEINKVNSEYSNWKAIAFDISICPVSSSNNVSGLFHVYNIPPPKLEFQEKTKFIDTNNIEYELPYSITNGSFSTSYDLANKLYTINKEVMPNYRNYILNKKLDLKFSLKKLNLNYKNFKQIRSYYKRTGNVGYIDLDAINMYEDLMDWNFQPLVIHLTSLHAQEILIKTKAIYEVVPKDTSNINIFTDT
jgi:hypothetical protein